MTVKLIEVINVDMVKIDLVVDPDPDPDPDPDNIGGLRFWY
jgi:hypothetical protein